MWLDAAELVRRVLFAVSKAIRRSRAGLKDPNRAIAEIEPEMQKEVKAFLEVRHELWWIAGRNIQSDIRWARHLVGR